MKKMIVITSGKGGVGKTTTAINLGAAMNYFGRDVLVVDGNITTPDIGIHLNSPNVPINLHHILLNKADVYEAVYEHKSGMKIVPSSLSIKDLKKIAPENIKNYKDDFKKISEYVIVDSSAGLGTDSLSLMQMADELIIITNPEMPALTNALKTIKMAEQMRKPILGVIVTRVKKEDFEIQPDTVKEMLEIPVLGMVPEDVAVPQSLNMKDAVVHTHPKSRAARAYKEIAAKLLEVPYNSDEDKEKLIERILKKFKLVK